MTSPTPDQQSTKESYQLFLNNDFYKTLLYFHIETQPGVELDEQVTKECFKSNECIQNLIQNIYLLYGNRSLLLVAKEPSQTDQLERLIKAHVTLKQAELRRQELPDTFGPNACPLFVTAELSDSQLELISTDKYVSLKTIEAKTGLKLKKIKKTIFFSGLLFQFKILNELLAEKARTATASSVAGSVINIFRNCLF